MIIDVAVFLPIENFLSYQVPEHLQTKASIGVRVVVPVRNSVEVGIIINVRDISEQEENITKELKEVIDIPDNEVVVNEEMIKLCRWISEYYISPMGLAFQIAVPKFLRSSGKPKYTINAETKTGYLPGSLAQQIIEILESQPLDLKELKKKFKKQGIEKEILALVKEGTIKLTFEPIKLREKIKKELWVRLKKDKTISQEEILVWQKKAPQQVKAYLSLLHKGEEYPLSDLLKKQQITKNTILSLQKKGWIELVEKEVLRTPKLYQYIEPLENAKDITLTDEQEIAVKNISDTLCQHQFKTFLLFGITGSGKTEVYLRAIKTAMDNGYQSLFLVPEIALTPQTVSRLYSRFKEQVAVLHSGLSDRERFDEWIKIKEVRVSVVIGVRSAIFAPFQKLGLIVVDEEHEHTYKQEETPRYHARDVAVMRAQINSAVCILGSATPSLESYVHTLESKYQLLKLTQRVASGSLPSIQVVNLKTETDKTSADVILSNILKEKIQERLERHEQVMLLINRRGFAPVMLCPSCGWIVSCPNCHTSLNYHRNDGTVRCHYCNYKQQRPIQCAECGTTPLILLGIGTQRIEDLLIRYFSEASISRMDTDVTTSKSRGYSILKKFGEQKIDILIGTQMIAKGHDYPNVTLVGVLNADIGLTLPNFRSAEFVFQLLMQVAGRSGRREVPGEVVIQTFMPNHYVIKTVQNHDYQMFVEHELRNRRAMGYPPYNRMIQFGIESEDEKEARDMAYMLVRYAQNCVGKNMSDCRVLGPAPGVIRRVQGRYRWQFALLGKATKTINRYARDINNHFQTEKTSNKLTLRIDVDPYEIY